MDRRGKGRGRRNAELEVLPGQESLAVGESLACHKSKAMSRIERKEVRVRLVGASSLGWL